MLHLPHFLKEQEFLSGSLVCWILKEWRWEWVKWTKTCNFSLRESLVSLLLQCRSGPHRHLHCPWSAPTAVKAWEAGWYLQYRLQSSNESALYDRDAGEKTWTSLLDLQLSNYLRIRESLFFPMKFVTSGGGEIMVERNPLLWRGT